MDSPHADLSVDGYVKGQRDYWGQCLHVGYRTQTGPHRPILRFYSTILSKNSLRAGRM